MFTKTALALAIIAAGLGVSATPPTPAQDSPKPTHILFFYEPSDAFSSRTGAKSGDYWQRWTAYIGKLQASGKMVSGNAIQAPATGSWIGKAVSTGPRLGGYVLVQADSLAAANALAKDCPAVADGGAVEVRPILPMTEGNSK
jgi:hypothetical protein